MLTPTCSKQGKGSDTGERSQGRKGAPTQETVGDAPTTGRATTQGLAFRYPTRYF